MRGLVKPVCLFLLAYAYTACYGTHHDCTRVVWWLEDSQAISIRVKKCKRRLFEFVLATIIFKLGFSRFCFASGTKKEPTKAGSF